MLTEGLTHLLYEAITTKAATRAAFGTAAITSSQAGKPSGFGFVTRGVASFGLSPEGFGPLPVGFDTEPVLTTFGVGSSGWNVDAPVRAISKPPPGS